MLVNGRKRWAGALATTPVSEVVLPEGISSTLEYLRNAYSGKQIEPELLIICPHTNPAWYWLYYKYCEKCPGHPLCLVDFLASPQMLAPSETETAHV